MFGSKLTLFYYLKTYQFWTLILCWGQDWPFFKCKTKGSLWTRAQIKQIFRIFGFIFFFTDFILFKQTKLSPHSAPNIRSLQVWRKQNLQLKVFLPQTFLQLCRNAGNVWERRWAGSTEHPSSLPPSFCRCRAQFRPGCCWRREWRLSILRSLHPDALTDPRSSCRLPSQPGGERSSFLLLIVDVRRRWVKEDNHSCAGRCDPARISSRSASTFALFAPFLRAHLHPRCARECCAGVGAWLCPSHWLHSRAERRVNGGVRRQTCDRGAGGAPRVHGGGARPAHPLPASGAHRAVAGHSHAHQEPQPRALHHSRTHAGAHVRLSPHARRLSHDQRGEGRARIPREDQQTQRAAVPQTLTPGESCSHRLLVQIPQRLLINLV